jgi:hypothetical protein
MLDDGSLLRTLQRNGSRDHSASEVERLRWVRAQGCTRKAIASRRILPDSSTGPGEVRARRATPGCVAPYNDRANIVFCSSRAWQLACVHHS